VERVDVGVDTKAVVEILTDEIVTMKEKGALIEAEI
jgi:hypothetical protein